MSDSCSIKEKQESELRLENEADVGTVSGELQYYILFVTDIGRPVVAQSSWFQESCLRNIS